MSKQRTMDLFRRPASNDPVPTEPVFWIEEVRLLKSFSPDPAEQIREPITFQKGLNIIWAPAPAMDKRKDINFAGHAAGKTTLCRLLRYLLGEKNTAAPGVKEAIEDNFYNGWIVGKIHVTGQSWIVARPLHHATRPRARCLKSKSFEELLQKPDTTLPGTDFETALKLATTQHLPAKLFGDGTTEITFEHVIQWLTRDQDCHLTKLHSFRHTDSQSGSPELKAKPANFLQRVLLNLADTDLQKAITECEAIEKEAKALPGNKEYLLRRENELNAFLEDASVKSKEAPTITEILIQPSRETAETLKQKKTKNTRDAIVLAKISKHELQDKLSTLQQDLGKVKINISNAQTAEKEAKNTLNALTGEKFNLDVEKEKAKKLPPTAYCRVPRQIAEERKCPAFLEWDALSENDEAKEKSIADRKTTASDYQGKCQTNFNNFTDEKNKIESDIKTNNGKVTSINKAIEGLNEKIAELEAPFSTITTKIDDLEEIIERLTTLRKRESLLDDEVKEAKELQEELHERHKKTEDFFVDEYAWTVAQIFGGEETTTKCKFTREQITTSITYHDKDLTSAAVTALKNLSFDIAAMTFSSRGRGHHPRFLLHDSPREADMAEAPYGRIFDLIVEQAKETPNFQHIISTTSHPPEEYQSLPYLRLQLNSASSQGRLFKQDL